MYIKVWLLYEIYFIVLYNSDRNVALLPVKKIRVKQFFLRSLLLTGHNFWINNILKFFTIFFTTILNLYIYVCKYLHININNFLELKLQHSFSRTNFIFLSSFCDKAARTPLWLFLLLARHLAYDKKNWFSFWFY